MNGTATKHEEEEGGRERCGDDCYFSIRSPFAARGRGMSCFFSCTLASNGAALIGGAVAGPSKTADISSRVSPDVLRERDR